jgi:hypothetical protein
VYIHVIQAMLPVDNAFAGVKTTDWINAGLYGEIAFIISKGAGGGSSAFVIQRARDANGTDAEAIGFRYSRLKNPPVPGDVPQPPQNATARGLAAQVGPNDTWLISVNNTIGTKPWVRLVMKEIVAEPVFGSVVALAFKGRFGSVASALSVSM